VWLTDQQRGLGRRKCTSLRLPVIAIARVSSSRRADNQTLRVDVYPRIDDDAGEYYLVSCDIVCLLRARVLPGGRVASIAITEDPRAFGQCLQTRRARAVGGSAALGDRTLRLVGCVAETVG
jgi:hypothetical protein